MFAVVVVVIALLFKIDATMERRICTAVLKQLDDNSNDVQTIAVKCLGALLRKVQEAQVRFAFCFSAAAAVVAIFVTAVLLLLLLLLLFYSVCRCSLNCFRLFLVKAGA